MSTLATAENKFKAEVWFVLNKIMDELLPNSFGEISYYFDINVTRIKPISYHDELRAIKFLLDNKVIEEVLEKNIVEYGVPGMKDYQVFEVYHFKINKRFHAYYEDYKLKILSKTNASSRVNLTKTRIKDLIEAHKISKKRARLLRALTSMKPIDRKELKRQIGTENLRKLVSETNKENLKGTLFKIIGVRSGTITGYSYQLTTIE